MCVELWHLLHVLPKLGTIQEKQNTTSMLFPSGTANCNQAVVSHFQISSISLDKGMLSNNNGLSEHYFSCF